MGERIGVVSVEFATQVESRRLAQIQIQNGVGRVGARHGNLVALRTQLFHAEHALLVKVQAHPLVGTLQDGLVHAIGVVLFNNVHILETKDFGGADHGRNVVRIEQVFQHHAEMPCATVHHRRQKFTAAFRHARQQGFHRFSFFAHFLSLII